jgi:hypothetical protein
MLECTTPAQVCCATGIGDGGCQPAASDCNGAKLACDEKADCTGGDVCCGKVGIGGAGSINTECKATCGGGLGALQLCKTNAECGAAGTCYANLCPTGLGPTSKKILIDACSKIPACTQ